jgi:hypothetical protein
MKACNECVDLVHMFWHVCGSWQCCMCWGGTPLKPNYRLPTSLCNDFR